MIRGAIEVAQSDRVSGWIYSASDTLRNKTLLAFSGGRCVGAGTVELFRQDLLDAKLGDGYCGFHFEIKLNEGESVGSVIVKLQYSDLALLQPASRVSGLHDADEQATGPDFGALQPAHAAWMMDRAMLEQPEFDFIKGIHSVGAYERVLRLNKRGAEDRGRLDPAAVAADMLGLFRLEEVQVSRASVASISELNKVSTLVRSSVVPVVVLWSAERGRISLEERSHLGGKRSDLGLMINPPPGGIDYSFGPDRMLFIHRDCVFSPRGPAPLSGITVFAAPEAAAAMAEQRQAA